MIIENLLEWNTSNVNKYKNLPNMKLVCVCDDLLVIFHCGGFALQHYELQSICDKLINLKTKALYRALNDNELILNPELIKKSD